MKKLIHKLAILMIFFVVSCESSTKNILKVGMIPDTWSIDDKSFNQSTWEGLKQAKEDLLNVNIKYLIPAGTAQADYLKEIGNFYDAGYKFIITPGYKFAGAVLIAQEKYKDAKFVLLDEAPYDHDGQPVIKINTVAVVFAEHQAGFIAAVAAAAEIEKGDFAFIGGMEGPPVQRFNWGFQQGVTYANTHLNTKITMKPENVIYQGTFYDIAAGQQLAAQLYNRGVKVIFTAAAAVGIGVINEAKTRSTKEPVWVVGADSDQFDQGRLPTGKSVILTSAIKNVKRAAYEMIRAEHSGNFPGGQILVFDARNDGIGLPEVNPNLSKTTLEKVATVLEKLKTREIAVSAQRGNWIK